MNNQFMAALQAKQGKEPAWEYLPIPEPAFDEVLIRVDQAALCESDLAWESASRDTADAVIPGRDFIGTVVKCGSSVDWIAPGERGIVNPRLSCNQCRYCNYGMTVLCEDMQILGQSRDGGLEEYCVVPALHFYSLDKLTDGDALLLSDVANAVFAIERAELRAGDRVVVIGDDRRAAVVSAIVSLYTPRCHILLGNDEARLERIRRECGADASVTFDRPNLIETINHDLLDGLGADVVIQCDGSRESVSKALHMVSYKGRVCVNGQFRQEDTLDIFTRTELQIKQVSLIGVSGWTALNYQKAYDYLQHGMLALEYLRGNAYGFRDWQNAFSDAKADPLRKTTITMNM